MDREKLDLWCERGIMGLVLAALVYSPLAMGIVRPLEFVTLLGFMVCILALWTVRFWLRSSSRFLWPPICWWVVGFVAYAALRYSTADIEYIARLELTKIFIYGLLFFVVLDNLNKQEWTQYTAFALVFLAMALAFLSVYQSLADAKHIWTFTKPLAYRGRGSGTYICPNHLAGFLEMALPLGLAYIVMGRLNHLLKIFLGYACLVIVAGLLFTFSRAGWCAAALSLLTFFGVLLFNRDHRMKSGLLLGIGVAVAVLFGVAFMGSASQLGKLRQRAEQTDPRFFIWKPALRLFLDNPWFGVGPDHFDERFPSVRPLQIQLKPDRVHNDYLNTLVDWGVTGFALVLGAFVSLGVGVFKSWKYVRRTSDLGGKPSNRAAFVLGASISVLALLLHSAADFNMHIPANAMILVSIMALLSGHLRFATEKYWVNVKWVGKLLGTIVCLAAMVFFCSQIRRLGIENKYFVLAEKTDKIEHYEESVAFYAKALAIEPGNPQMAFLMGDAWRNLSWQGLDGYEAKALEAMRWFRLATCLNPYQPENYVKYGMCLDWIGRHDAAALWFHKASKIDPNSYFTRLHEGWHFMQLDDYENAQKWFFAAREAKPSDYSAWTYWKKATDRLEEQKAKR